MTPTSCRMARVATAALCLAAMVSIPGAAPAGASLRPDVRTLDNGLVVAVFHDPRLPVVQFQLTVPAGSAAEDKGQSGAARLVAEMLRRGTASRDAKAFAADVGRLGGEIATSSGRDYSSISGAFLARDLEAGLELASDAVTNAVFSAEEFQRLRDAQRRQIGNQLMHPAQSADELMWSTVLEGTPYARPVQGSFEGVKVLALESARDFYRLRWAPEHAVLAIAGDVAPERAFAAAGEVFGRWVRRQAPAPPRAASPVARARVRIIDRPDLERVEIRIGLPGPPRGHADEVALAVAGRVLGGGRESRLARLASGPAAVREARGMQASLRDGGLFWVAATAPADSAAAVVGILRAALEELRDRPPDEAELAPVRRLVSATFPLQLETLGALITQWSGGALCGLQADELQSLPGRVQELSATRLGDALGRWLDPARATVVIVGPGERLRPQFERPGPVEVLAVEALAGRAEDETPPLPAFTAAQEKLGRELVRKLVAAHGGLAKLRGIKDSAIEADVTLTMEGREVSGRVEQIRKEPYRMVYVTRFARMAARQVLDGRQAWGTDQMGGAEIRDLDTVAVAALRNGFRSDLPHVLLEAASPESRVGSVGRDRLDGREAEKVEVRSAAGGRRVLYIEMTARRLAGMDFNEDPAAVASFGARRVYRGYRPVAGVTWPFEEERWLDGQRVMDLRYTRVELNKGVEDGVFARPEEPLPPPSR